MINGAPRRTIQPAAGSPIVFPSALARACFGGCVPGDDDHVAASIGEMACQVQSEKARPSRNDYSPAWFHVIIHRHTLHVGWLFAVATR